MVDFNIEPKKVVEVEKKFVISLTDKEAFQLMGDLSRLTGGDIDDLSGLKEATQKIYRYLAGRNN